MVERSIRPRGGCGRSPWSPRLAKSVALEMDLRMEAAAISEMAENSPNDQGFRVPRSTGRAPRGAC